MNPNPTSPQPSEREEGTCFYEVADVYEFRPLPGYFTSEVRRYAKGKWLPDDGEYDLAFIGKDGAPICLMFDPSYQRNILASWVSKHWSAHERRHRGGNPWHYALREGATEWGGDWGRHNHENRRAGDAGMSKMSSECGCSNGRHVEPTNLQDAHILAGLVRNRETKAILRLPEAPVCMYCGDTPSPQKQNSGDGK